MEHNPYETEPFVVDYLLFHYGQPEDLCLFDVIPRELLRFHERIREECVAPTRFAGLTSGLDIGCGVGRFTFELGRVVDRVLGIDSSKSFINAARLMQETQARTIPVKETGNQFRPITLNLPSALCQGKVEFQVGEAQDLTALPDRSFHIVAAINLICRLPRPREFLADLYRLLPPEGQLIVASPFSWMREFTAPDQWLNSEEIERVLQTHFRLVSRRDVPFMIREHRRKFELVISEVFTFLRRAD